MKSKVLITMTIVGIFLLTACSVADPTLKDVVNRPSLYLNREITVEGFLGLHEETNGGYTAFVVPTEAETEMILPSESNPYAYGFPLSLNGEILTCSGPSLGELACTIEFDEGRKTIRGTLKKTGNQHYIEVFHIIKTDSPYAELFE